MYRRAYTLLVGNAIVMGVLAVIVAVVYDKRLLDPEGSFLGPSWARLPILLGAALALDLVPRALWKSRLNPKLMPQVVKERWRQHWNRERLTLVALGVICFYVVYVSYRNLKSFLPSVVTTKYDRELHMLDRALLFGHDPAILLHRLLGEGFMAWPLSFVYLWFLPLVPIAVTCWLVWSRNLSYGYWFVTSQCLAWSLGTASYYALPTLGPGLKYVWLYEDLPPTPASQLMESLAYGRNYVYWGVNQDAVQSVAGFASLHVAITLLVALMVQYTVRARWLKIVFWVNCAITAVATLYFGWHYIADDIAGVMIAFVSFYVGGLASGQKFDKHGLHSHPTTTTSAVPVDR
ncbi:phosphatase PAP2 family protein [Nocardioides aquiterrae]|uniref:Inositolphosphotransferase Aur1/Ipt1 domain-containing protein n=1 Tax=Nocardioides aquiterrae TaxID=203799 RepID=A0ABP4EYY7_9ACTN